MDRILHEVTDRAIKWSGFKCAVISTSQESKHITYVKLGRSNGTSILDFFSLARYKMKRHIKIDVRMKKMKPQQYSSVMLQFKSMTSFRATR